MGRSRQQYCNRGHDTLEVGRYSSGTCCLCAREREAKKRQARVPSRDRPYCTRGHDKRVVGVYANGYCKLCDRLRRGAGMCPSRRIQERVNWDRGLAALLWAEYWGITIDSGVRAATRLWARSQLAIDQADHWCLVIGSSLAAMYPEVYEVA